MYRRQLVGPERSFALSVWFSCRRFCASRLRVSLCVLHALLAHPVFFWCFIGCIRLCAQRTTVFHPVFFFFVCCWVISVSLCSTHYCFHPVFFFFVCCWVVSVAVLNALLCSSGVFFFVYFIGCIRRVAPRTTVFSRSFTLYFCRACFLASVVGRACAFSWGP